MYSSFLRSLRLPLSKWFPGLCLLFLAGCEDQAGLRESNQQTPLPVTRMTEFGPGTVDAANTSHPYINSRHAINEGKRLYAWFNCVGCHANGGGGMGPPLIDETWIYGSTPANIYSSIMEGRPNGMPAFHGKIPEQEVWKLVAYVRSLGGLDDSLPQGATTNPVKNNSNQDKQNHGGINAGSGSGQE